MTKITITFLSLLTLTTLLSTRVQLVGAHSNEDGVIIHMYNDRYEPQDATIQQGEKVVFENAGEGDHWPASNIHPTHRLYPGSDIDKCGTKEEDALFDACKGIKPGETYELVFEKAGDWRYHDHLFPNLKGTITVEKVEGSALEEPQVERSHLFARIVTHIRALLARIFPSLAPIDTSREFYEYETNADKDIPENSQEIFTDKQALYSYVKKYGPGKATLHLHELSDTFGSCHNNAHDVGRYAYSITGGEAFQKCSAECHSGCYHGATEAYFRDKGVENLISDLKLLCGDALNPFFNHQCIHGIGHGLMAYEDYDIHQALKDCDLLPEGQESCYSGVFMENIVGGLTPAEGHFTEYLNDDPHFPCNVVEEKYIGACYFYQSSHMIQLFNGDFAKLAKACGDVEQQYQRLCFESMGRDVGGVNRNYPEGSIEDCQSITDDTNRISCLTGAVQDSFWDPSGQDTALRFCKLLVNEAEKSACYNTIFGRSVDVLTPNEMDQFCSKVEQGFHQSCLAHAN